MSHSYCIAALLLVTVITTHSALANPLNRADGIASYPYRGELNEPDQHHAYMGSANAVTYTPIGRIRVKLTRIVKINTETLQAPEISYFGALSVGSHGLKFNVVFDTGSNEIWLPSYNWFPLANNLHYSSGYDYKDSNTSVQGDNKFTIVYRGTSLTGRGTMDTFTIYDDLTKDQIDPSENSLRITFPQNFLLVSDASDEQFRYKPYDGVVGLAPVLYSNIGTNNLLVSMQDHYAQASQYGMNRTNPASIYDGSQYPPLVQPMPPYGAAQQYPASSYEQDQYYRQQRTGLVDPENDLIFAFWFNPNQDSRNGGELVLGDINRNRFMGQIYYYPILRGGDWKLPLEYVQLGSQIVSCAVGCGAILDTGANSLIGPRDDVLRIHQELQAVRNDRADMWLVDCNDYHSFPILHFRIGGHPYQILPQHYVKEFRFQDKLICYLAIKPRDSQDWVLGTTFIGAYYTVFNYSQRKVGFATPIAY